MVDDLIKSFKLFSQVRNHSHVIGKFVPNPFENPVKAEWGSVLAISESVNNCDDQFSTKVLTYSLRPVCVPMNPPRYFIPSDVMFTSVSLKIFLASSSCSGLTTSQDFSAFRW